MRLNSIVITCPKCGKEFEDIIADSINSLSAKAVNWKSETFSEERNCPCCKERFNIYDDGHGRRRFHFEQQPRFEKVKNWLKTFLP